MKQQLKYISSMLFLCTIYSCSTTINTPNNSLNINKPINIDSNNSNNKISDLKYNGSFNGQVFDRKGNPVEKVTVNAKSIESDIKWESEIKTTNENGEYSFANAPISARLLITISKDGISKTRTEVLETGLNLKNNPLINTFNFNSYYTLDSTLIKIFLFDDKKNEIKDALVSIESLDPNFNFIREYKAKGDNIIYSSSKEPLPINTKFKIIVKANGKEKEQIITTEPSKIYNEINFII